MRTSSLSVSSPVYPVAVDDTLTVIKRSLSPVDKSESSPELVSVNWTVSPGSHCVVVPSVTVTVMVVPPSTAPTELTSKKVSPEFWR